MIRTLLIIAGAALVLCVATLSGAAAIGGNDLARHGWTWTFKGHGDGGDETVHFRREDDSPPVTRNLAWTGGQRLEIDIPGDVTYVQGDTPSVVISGPKSRADRVTLIAGRLGWSDDGDEVVVGWGRGRSSRLRVVVTAPGVNSFELNSSADLSIRDYNQPSLAVRVTGSGEVDAAGQTQAVTVDLTGSGEVDLSSLQTTDATVTVDGSGDVSVGPTGSARIDVSGSGDVDLTRRPANLQQSVSGSGDIVQN